MIFTGVLIKFVRNKNDFKKITCRKVMEIESKNLLYYGDNLEILRNKIKDESIDLCYIDPPFNSKRNYNQIEVISKLKIYQKQNITKYTPSDKNYKIVS